MTNTHLKYMLMLFTGIAIGFILQRCNNTPEIIEITDKAKEVELYTALNNANASKDYWKKQAESKDTVYKTIIQKRDRIVYRTTFDTLATIDTVLVELIKCDSVVKYSDTALVNRNEKIEDLTYAIAESENAQAIQGEIIEEKNKVIKKERKAKVKAFFKGALVGAVVITLIILL